MLDKWFLATFAHAANPPIKANGSASRHRVVAIAMGAATFPRLSTDSHPGSAEGALEAYVYEVPIEAEACVIRCEITSLFVHRANPFAWSSDWDALGYREQEFRVVSGVRLQRPVKPWSSAETGVQRWLRGMRSRSRRHCGSATTVSIKMADL